MTTRFALPILGVLLASVANVPAAASGGLNGTNVARLGSVAALSSRSGAGGSYAPSFSADGRFVVFTSHAHNLVTNDVPGRNLDVFVRDLAAGKTTLASVNVLGLGGGSELSKAPSISSNGQVVCFTSRSSNLVSQARTNLSTAFVRNIAAGTTTGANVGTNGELTLNSYVGAYDAVMSANGRFVAFSSSARDLAPGDNDVEDIFVRDVVSNRTVLVSVGATGRWSQNWSRWPNISADGRRVAFVSTASNLVAGATNPDDVYVRDLDAGVTFWPSTNVMSFLPPGVGYHFGWPPPMLSGDGRSVIFAIGPSASAGGFLLFRHELDTATTTLINASDLSATNRTEANLQGVSFDGRFVLWDNATNIFVWDAQSQSNALVSVNADGSGPGNGVSEWPAMSADGRYVAFVSYATALTTNPPSGVAQVYLRDLVAAETRLISVDRNGAPSSRDHDVTQPAISPDGRLVAFESADDNLVEGDSNGDYDVFVRDWNAGTTQLVSERASSRPAVASSGFCTLANSSCISSNARWLVFTSTDSDLVAGDTNGLTDIFVRDLETGTNFGVTRGTNFAEWPVISADGRYVAYMEWNAAVAGATGAISQIYRCDVQSGVRELVSVSTNGTPANASSAVPTISPDGRLVAFQSSASDLVNLGAMSYVNIFVRDMVAGTNLLVSATVAGTYALGPSSDPVFSPDGRWILFDSLAANLVWNRPGSLFGDIYARDLAAISTLLVSTSRLERITELAFSADSRLAVFPSEQSIGVAEALFVSRLDSGTSEEAVPKTCDPTCVRLTGPSISRDGRWLAYQARSAFTGEIRLLDRQASVTKVVARTPWDALSIAPVITPDGEFVVFASKTSNGGPGSVSQLFVYDRLQNTTLVATLNRSDLPANAASERAFLAGDGRTVVFQSFATDLTEGDYNLTRNLFILRLSTGDLDGDGLDDDWEMACFSTLSRDGSGDFDGDGHTDLEEFRAGTDPTNRGSVLRVMTLAPVGGNGATLLWPAAPGRTYQVQCKDELDGSPWFGLSGAIQVSNGTASLHDATAGAQPHRFYRVLLVP